jgi:cell division protein FtsZ
MADQVLYSGVACITDLMVKEGLINLDFADVRSVMREMGRAMMGTGEASGQGRAMQAAEAAIANPLLDETSMKGAQGLLISITGGRDLTLFEVDEAATRIREEVDPDANIILGATFDESVAKPAIRPSAAAAPAAAAAQPAHVAQAHTAPAPRTIDPVAQTIRAAEADLERELEIQMGRQPQVQQQPVMPQASAPEENFRPQSRIFAAAPEAQPVRQAPVQPQPAPVMQQQPIIRQAPEQVRMPKVEDFPPVVKAEMEHRAQPVAAQAAEERGPMGLLKRITNSLGRRDEDPAFDDMMAPAAAAPQQRRAPSPEASLYAPRRGQLDDQGRQVPAARMTSHEDDQLEIPAFLRRQSN